MADIKISTQVLMDTAGKVRSINATLTEKLNEINYTMQSLEGSWKSDAATDIRTAMQNLKPRFEQYNSVVESYAKFLVNTAQSNDSTEGAVQTNAQAFRQ